MDSVQVVSSNIEKVGYQSGTLYIQFKSGVSYSYEGAPYQVYKDLAAAESVGRAFHRLVKGKYRYARLPTTPF